MRGLLPAVVAGQQHPIQETDMNYSAPETIRFANPAPQGHPNPLARWWQAVLRPLLRTAAPAPPARDAVREAAEVRDWAVTLQRTHPSFATELFAAADRHELQGL